MESDIEEGEIIDEIPATSPVSSNSSMLPDRKLASQQRRHGTAKSSNQADRVRNGPAKRKRSTEGRVNTRRPSTGGRRSRKSSRSPSPELPKQYRNRLQENIHRRRLRHSRKSSSGSRSNSPYACRRVQNHSTNKTVPNTKENITVTKRNGKRRLILRSNSENGASDTSIISVSPPPKTLPELIVLDSSPNSDSDGEDVKELQLRKEALEAMLCNFEDSIKQEKENDIGSTEIYSPTSAIFDDYLENNLCPAEKMEVSYRMERMQERDSSKLDPEMKFAVDQNTISPVMDVATIPLPPATPVASFLDPPGLQGPSSLSSLPLRSTGDVDMRFVSLNNNAANTAALLHATLAQNYQAIAQLGYSGDRDQLFLQNAALIQSLMLSTAKLPSGTAMNTNPLVFPNPFFDVDSRQHSLLHEVPSIPVSVPTPFGVLESASEQRTSPTETESSVVGSQTLEASCNVQAEDVINSAEPAQEILSTEFVRTLSTDVHEPVTVQKESPENIDSNVVMDEPKTIVADIKSQENTESIDWNSLFTRRRKSPTKTYCIPEIVDDETGNIEMEIPSTQLIDRPKSQRIDVCIESEELQNADAVANGEHGKTIDSSFDAGGSPGEEVPTVEDHDDSITEDEEVLRAQLLLDLSRKKITKQPTVSAQKPASPTVFLKPPFVRLPAPVLPAPIRPTASSSYASYNQKIKGMFRVVNVNNDKARMINAKKIPQEKAQYSSPNYAEPIRPPGPHLQIIRRTIINTNAVKKNIYTRNADPVLKNLKIVVPNKVTPVRPLIIPVRHDDSSSEDEEPTRNERQSQVSSSNAVSLPKNFQSSLDDLLKNSRQQSKPVTEKSSANEALKHLPASKREEYLELKKQIERHERLIQKKQESKRHKALARSLSRTAKTSKEKEVQEPETAIAVSLIISKPDEVRSILAEVPKVSLSAVSTELEKSVEQIPQDSSTSLLESVERADSDLQHRQNRISRTSNEISAVIPSPSSLAQVTEMNSTTMQHTSDPMIQVDTSSLTELEAEEALLAEDSDFDEPIITFVPDEKLLESDIEDEQSEAMEPEPKKMEEAKTESHAEREELYLREQLLKATLLRKMEDSGEKLLKHSENGVVSSRMEINRELTSLLAEISRMSDLKALVKSRQESVAALRNQLYIAEQKLDNALLSFDNHNKRRKTLTGKALRMRKQCITLVKQCRSQGQKLKGQSYRVPAVGVREMKLKLQEVRKQNIIFRKEYLKLKKSIARLDLQNPNFESFKSTGGPKRNLTPRSKKARGTKRHPKYNGSMSRPGNQTLLNFKASTTGSPNKLADYRRLTKYGNCSDDESHSDSESVFLLPYFRFKDVMFQDRPSPMLKGRKPVVPYTEYESPISCIAQHFARRSSRPGLSSNVDPFSSLCFFELRGMCNDADCSFQHLYRSNSNGQNRATSTTTPKTLS